MQTHDTAAISGQPPQQGISEKTFVKINSWMVQMSLLYIRILGEAKGRSICLLPGKWFPCKQDADYQVKTIFNRITSALK